MKQRWMRVLSFILVLAMVFSIVPVLGQTVSAQEASAYQTIQEVVDGNRFQAETLAQEDEVVFLVELEEQPPLGHRTSGPDPAAVCRESEGFRPTQHHTAAECDGCQNP